MSQPHDVDNRTLLRVGRERIAGHRPQPAPTQQRPFKQRAMPKEI